MMGTTKSNEDRLAEALRFYADEIEKEAFSIPAPNGHTPKLVSLAMGMRQVAYKALAAHEASRAEVSDDELPGMWSQSDFIGGDPDERSYAQRERDAKGEVSEAEVDAFEKEYERVHVSLGCTPRTAIRMAISAARDAARNAGGSE